MLHNQLDLRKNIFTADGELAWSQLGKYKVVRWSMCV